MPLYQYIYIDKKRKKRKSILFAKSYDQIKNRLVRDKIAFIRIQRLEENHRRDHFNLSISLRFFSQLERLIAAKIPIYEALKILSFQFRESKIYPVISAVEELVLNGTPLHVALKRFPKSFPPYVQYTIKAGEVSGDLHQALLELTNFIRWKISFRKKLINAMIYPLFLISFGIGLFFLVSLFVIPSMQELISDQSSFFLTNLILKYSEFMTAHIDSIVLLLLSAVAAVLIILRQPARRTFLSNTICDLPILRPLISDFALLQYFQTLSILTRSSYPLLDSLEIANDSLKGQDLRQSFLKSHDQLANGYTLSSSFKENSYIPKIIYQIIEVGEYSGDMSLSISSAKEHFTEKVEKRLEFIQKYAQPILILLIGGMIGLLMLSILLPMTDMSNLKM